MRGGLVVALLAIITSTGCIGDESREAPYLIVRVGDNNPGSVPSLTGAAGIAVVQVALEAAGAPVNVSSIRFHASGTGDDSMHLSRVRLFRDANGDGGLDGGDALLGSAAGYPADDGTALFWGLAEAVSPRETVNWLLVYDVAPGLGAGDTFCATILDESDVVATRKGAQVRVEAPSVITGCFTASSGSVTLTVGPATPPSRMVGRCASTEAILQLRLEAGAREDVQVDSVTFTASGSGIDPTDVAAVWLYVDENGDGTLDGSDTVLGGPEFHAADDGPVVFSSLGRVLNASSNEEWLLVYSLSAGISEGATFRARIDSDGDILATGIGSGQTASVSGAPAIGEEVTIWGPVLVAAAFEDVNGNEVADPGDTVTLRFTDAVAVTWIPAPDSAIDLDPPGTFGTGMTLSPGSLPTEMVIGVGEGTDVMPNGTYGIDAGSTGVNIASGQVKIIDCLGAPVRPNPIPLDMSGELHPRIQTVGFADADGDCVPGAGDLLEVTFTKNVSLTTADPARAFHLPVAGDSLGSGARFLGGGAPTDVDRVTVVMGSAATLSVATRFDPVDLTPGAPSGLEVTTSPGVILDAAYPSVSAGPFSPAGRDVAPLPVWVANGDGQDGARFGASVASAGDVNGDGYGDLIVGAPYYHTTNLRAGEAYLYLGGAGGLSPVPAWRSSGDDRRDAYFGDEVASAGDVNGDGFDDVVVGARTFDSTSYRAGKAYLYLGGSGGLSAVPAWTSVGDDVPGAYFAMSVASAGDVDGDGYADVVIGAPYYWVAGEAPGKAYVYLGSASGLSPAPVWTSIGEAQPDCGFGGTVSSAGDVNADGYDDVIVGARKFDSTSTSAGKAYLFLGGPAGPSVPPAWSSVGDDRPSAFFGNVSSAGDVNGDGFSDVVVGAGGLTTAEERAGKVYLFLGGIGGLSAAPSWVSSGDNRKYACFGASVSSAGDVNGDGFTDVIVGTTRSLERPEGDIPIAYLYPGSPTGLSLAPIWIANGEVLPPSRADVVTSAGDVDGDGRPEIVVGSELAPPAVGAGVARVYCVSP